MGVLIYIVVEIALGVGSFFAFHAHNDVLGWVLLVLFVLGLLPLLGEDVADIFDIVGK